MLDLRREARALAIVLPELSLSDEARAAAVDEWLGRMVNEHVSARVFAALIPQLMRAGVDASEQAVVADMVGQELRHGRLCAAVVDALGGDARAPLPELVDVPTHDDATPLEAVLRNVLSISCLNETVAVALLETGRELAGPPPIRRILTEILRDEVNHAKLGWRLVERLLPRVDAATRARLDAYLVPAFRQLLERHYVPDHLARPISAPEVGVDDTRASCALFLDVVTTVIVPGLEAHGLDARAAVAIASAA